MSNVEPDGEQRRDAPHESPAEGSPPGDAEVRDSATETVPPAAADDDGPAEAGSGAQAAGPVPAGDDPDAPATPVTDPGADDAAAASPATEPVAISDAGAAASLAADPEADDAAAASPATEPVADDAESTSAATAEETAGPAAPSGETDPGPASASGASPAPPAAMGAPAAGVAAAAASAAESVMPGTRWGYVDDDGNVRQRDSVHLRGRVIGKLAGRSRYSVFQFFVDRFAKLEHHAEVLGKEMAASPNRGRFSERVVRLLDRVRKADALGDFDALIGRLERMLSEIETYQAEQAALKETLCQRAEALVESTDWVKTTAAMKTLQQEWRTLGSSTRELDEIAWSRFRGAMDRFFARRDEDRKQKTVERSEGRRIKSELCEKAEALTESTSWKKTADEQEALMAAWKAAPWAGRGVEERLWKRFRAARSRFFEHRAEDRKKRQVGFAENRARKDALCEAAEALLQSQDHYAACEQVKQLQAEWKKIGPVPRAVSETQWARFRSACNEVFSRARAARASERGPARRGGPGGRPGRKPDGRGRREAVPRRPDRTEALRESIVRDQGHLDRWRQTLDRMKGGGAMREALEVKVREIEERIEADRARLAELETAARKEREEPARPTAAAAPAAAGSPAPDVSTSASSGPSAGSSATGAGAPESGTTAAEPAPSGGGNGGSSGDATATPEETTGGEAGDGETAATAGPDAEAAAGGDGPGAGGDDSPAKSASRDAESAVPEADGSGTGEEREPSPGGAGA